MKHIAVTLWLLAVAPLVHALDAAELLRQVDRNLQPESYEMYRKLINVEPDGRRKEFVLYSVKKGGDKVLALFLDPPSEKGRSTLRLGDNMWLYIPNVGKPLRITSLQSVIGGVFNNADILRVDYAAEYDAESVDETADGYVLKLKAKNATVAYDRLVMQVSRQHKVPVTIEAYAASGLLIKTLRYSQMKDFGDGLMRPSVLETDSPLYQNHKSVMIYASIKQRDLPDEVFSLNYMGRVDDLRGK
jgi:outer membrane lipoprotein-sorting protein